MRTSADFKSFTVSFTGPVISDTENDAETTCLRVVIEIDAGARWCRLLLHWAAKGLTCTHDDRMDNGVAAARWNIVEVVC